MAARRSFRGVGSNQYVDKAPSPKEDEQLSAHVRKMQEHSVPPRMVTAEGDASLKADRALVGNLSTAIDRHFDRLGLSEDGVADSAPLTEAATRRSVGEVAAAEDEVLRRYPNYYGHCVVSATYWSKRVQHDPVIRQKLDRNDPETVRLHDAYVSVLQDAIGTERLDVDQITKALDDISEIEEKGPFVGTEKETQDSRQIHRFAALSVVSSRMDEGPDDETLAEMERIRGDLNRSMVDRRIRL